MSTLSPSGVSTRAPKRPRTTRWSESAGIVAVEDDLAARERPPARDREQPAHVLGRQIGEQRPLHARQSV